MSWQGVYSIKHDITDVQCLMPGLLLAIRKVVRLKVPTQSNDMNSFYPSASSGSTFFYRYFTNLAEFGIWPGEVYMKKIIHLFNLLAKNFNLVQLKGPSTPASIQTSHRRLQNK
ncbi:hypothetical protein V8G54_031115 [Vigna mungo]|uniref:Uncharacterized protein n=1 Tax=Vigna mungo TaxID=3915 RepID=A0AAQ3MWA5_VIGMU